MKNKEEMAKRVLAAFGGAWNTDIDTENLFPNLPLLEEMEEVAKDIWDVQPRKTLRENPYGTMPLIVRPEYNGDFLEKFKNKTAGDPNSLLDFSSPEELLKHQEEPNPRDLCDEFYDINRPGEGVGYKTLKDYYDRGWDENDAPEFSEDKILRMRNFFNGRPPQNPEELKSLIHSAQRIVQAFLDKDKDPRVQMVLAKYMMENFPTEMTLIPQLFSQSRVAKILKDFDATLIYTKSKGWRKPDPKSVSVRLFRAEPKVGRWTFTTSSGRESYYTIFQFIPQGTVKEVNGLHVRVNCTCPSFLFWGAQYHAIMEDYFYGRVRPKFTKPEKRDPTGRFLVCKHILACIPTVEKYRLQISDAVTRKKLMAPPKLEMAERDVRDFILVLQKKIKKETDPIERKKYQDILQQINDLVDSKDKSQLKKLLKKLETDDELAYVPPDLMDVERSPEIRNVLNTWGNMSKAARKNFIFNLKDPRDVAFMAHRFPITSTLFVIEKLKKMTLSEKSAVRQEAKELLQEII